MQLKIFKYSLGLLQFAKHKWQISKGNVGARSFEVVKFSFCWSQSYNTFHNIERLFDILPKFSFHHEWKEAWLLIINMAYTNFLTCFRTTYNLESQEIRKYQENLKNSQNNSLVPSLPAKMKILLILAKNSLKNRN